MTGQRISLTRIIAVQWYGFRQILDVENLILVAGAFKSGKSALLDLMQYVMVGDGWRPNRAAAGNAKGRSLVSYCLCDTNTTRDGEPHYTRRNGVSLIALEFTWPAASNQTPRRETWGIRIQYASPTSRPEQTYFCVPARLDWSELAPNGDLMAEDEFKSHIRREYEIGAARNCLFPRQRDYLAEMATPHHLWFDEHRFLKTFPKAIAFEPEKEVENFVREYILEENPLDVSDVKAAVGAYRETQARLTLQDEEATALREISKEQLAYEKVRRDASVFQHLSPVLEHVRIGELIVRHRKDLAELESRHAEDNKAFDALLAEIKFLEKAIREFRLDAGDDELRQKRSEQETKRTERKELLDAQQSIRKRLRDLRQRWTAWLRRGAELKLDGLVEQLTVEYNLLDALSAADEGAGLKALQDLAERFNQLFRAVDKLLEPHRSQILGISNRLKQIVVDLERLEGGQTPGSFPLFQAIRTPLAGSPNPPEQLCRLLEVKPQAEEWRNALELLLGRNRFAIVVGSLEHYRAALEILRNRPVGERGIDESLIHPREALELAADVRKDSLAEKVEMAKAPEALQRVADQFTRQLLGRVIAAERIEDLDLCERGITRDGIYKQAPTRRRLRQLAGFEFTLGTEGLKRLLAALTREQGGLMADRTSKEAFVQGIHQWLESGKQGGLGDARLPDPSADLPRLPVLERELAELKERIDFLATPERAERLRQLDGFQERLGKANIEIGGLGNARQQYGQKKKEIEEALNTALETFETAELNVTESRSRLPQGVLDAEIDGHVTKLKITFASWNERKTTAGDWAKTAAVEAEKTRNNRNNQRRALITAVDDKGKLKHPQYRHDNYDPEEEGNERWQARLRMLDEVQLGASRKLAAERRKDWEGRLKNQVLNRLNENLQAAERAVRQLRGYLDVPVGGQKYRISQERDTVGLGRFWSLLDSGFEPTDELGAAGRTEEMQGALDELMKAVDSNGESDARALELLDYRNYHRYDIKMRPVDIQNAPEISFGRSGVNMSGGENQAPFFLSMLAAFLRVYDLGGGRSQHLGLVVMDEAFSKLSGDGVEDCLEVARNFNLQLLMAFPIDRLGVMAPYADTIVELRKEEARDAAGFVVQLDNIPVILAPDQVQEKVE